MWMDEEEQRRLDIARSRYSQQARKDLLREYVESRLLLKNPFAATKVYVLEPLYEYCRFDRMPMEHRDTWVSTSRPIPPPRENCYMHPDRDGGKSNPAILSKLQTVIAINGTKTSSKISQTAAR